MLTRCLRTPAMLLLSLLMASPGLIDGNVLAQGDARPLRVAVTVPDLGSLVREIGGDHVAVTVFAKGTEDLHTIEAKPSFIKTLSEAELFIQMGMEMELGWVPLLQQGARNARVLPGARGFLDASTVITPLEVPSGQVDRSMGDVHPAGNPHYLLDPLNGLRVARVIRDKLIDLRPERQKAFDQRFAQFVAERTGAQVVSIAHTVGARGGTHDYIAMVDYDVRQLALALRGRACA